MRAVIVKITDRVISALHLTSPLPRGHETGTNVYIGGKCGIFFISTPDLEISTDYHQIESWVVPTEVLYNEDSSVCCWAAGQT